MENDFQNVVLSRYCLVTSYNPLTIYLHRGGFCRFSMSRFSMEKSQFTNVSAHLTNVAVQKHTAKGKDACHGCNLANLVVPSERSGVRLRRNERLDGTVEHRPAHILGGWSPSTPRFPKNLWEIVKIHVFSLKLIDFHGKSTKNRGF